MAALYRRMHIALVPSRATATWVEQFDRWFADAVAAFERGAEGRPTDTKIQIRVAGA